MVSLPGGHDLGMVPTPRPYESFQQKSPVVSIPVASLAASAASEMEYSSSSSSSSSSFFFFLVFLVFLVFLRPPSDDAPSSLSSSRRKSYSSAAIRSNNLSISGEFSRDPSSAFSMSSSSTSSSSISSSSASVSLPSSASVVSPSSESASSANRLFRNAAYALAESSRPSPTSTVAQNRGAATIGAFGSASSVVAVAHARAIAAHSPSARPTRVVTPRRAVFAEGSGKSAVDSSHVVVVVVFIVGARGARRSRRRRRGVADRPTDRPTDRPVGRSEKISSPR